MAGELVSYGDKYIGTKKSHKTFRDRIAIAAPILNRIGHVSEHLNNTHSDREDRNWSNRCHGPECAGEPSYGRPRIENLPFHVFFYYFLFPAPSTPPSVIAHGQGNLSGLKATISCRLSMPSLFAFISGLVRWSIYIVPVFDSLFCWEKQYPHGR